MNFVEAYFDESGSHKGSPVLCVAGYLIESESAKLLSKEWAEVLGSKGLRALVLDAEKILKHASEMTAMDAWGKGSSQEPPPS